MKIQKEKNMQLNESNFIFPKIGDLEGDSKILGHTPNANIEKTVIKIMNRYKYVYDYLKDN